MSPNSPRISTRFYRQMYGKMNSVVAFLFRLFPLNMVGNFFSPSIFCFRYFQVIFQELEFSLICKTLEFPFSLYIYSNLRQSKMLSETVKKSVTFAAIGELFSLSYLFQRSASEDTFASRSLSRIEKMRDVYLGQTSGLPKCSGWKQGQPHQFKARLHAEDRIREYFKLLL